MLAYHCQVLCQSLSPPSPHFVSNFLSFAHTLSFSLALSFSLSGSWEDSVRWFSTAQTTTRNTDVLHLQWEVIGRHILRRRELTLDLCCSISAVPELTYWYRNLGTFSLLQKCLLNVPLNYVGFRLEGGIVCLPQLCVVVDKPQWEHKEPEFTFYWCLIQVFMYFFGDILLLW